MSNRLYARRYRHQQETNIYLAVVVLALIALGLILIYLGD